MQQPPDEYDSPWKDALSDYLRDCLALLFPLVHAGIDWSRPPVFLDTELQQILRDADTGRRSVDRLVKVWLPGGEDAWLLLHLEVQSQPDQGFAKRMFTYAYRILDRYDREVVGLAVLADTRPSWRPETFTLTRWGCTLHYTYLVAKLADWRSRLEELEREENPFATMLLAHLAAQETRRQPARREARKVHLIRRLYARGYSRERILSLFRLIDWLLRLPDEGEARVQRAIEQLEEERKMPYVTSFERLGLARGRQEGREEGREEGRAEGREEGRNSGLEEGLAKGLQARREDVLRIVQARFGQVPPALAETVGNADEETLSALIVRAATAAAVGEV